MKDNSNQFNSKPKYITKVEALTHLSADEKEVLKKVAEKYAFRVNDYYLKLINWSDPNDPIRRLVIPASEELIEYGKWDASDEYTNYAVKGCQHKYQTTTALMVSELCGANCRYCFRKRLFRSDAKEAPADVSEGLDYIQKTPQINNVLLTGGDPLALTTQKLAKIIERLREIDHVKIIRIGSKMPVFNPMRIFEDQGLLDLIRRYSKDERRIYVMTHIDHPTEITPEARRAFQSLHDAGAILANQTPILKGINNDPVILGELLDKLSWAGITPYYLFVSRPVSGNSSFMLTLVDVYNITEEAKARTSGLGKRVKLVMSHSSGKIEILAIENGKAYLKYHQSRSNSYKFMILDCPSYATWFDDQPNYRLI